MGACSSKPKTADFEGIVSACNHDALQIESEKQSLDYELQSEAGARNDSVTFTSNSIFDLELQTSEAINKDSRARDESVGRVNGTQTHDSENSPEIIQSALIVSKTHDSEWTTINFTKIPSHLPSEVIQRDARHLCTESPARDRPSLTKFKAKKGRESEESMIIEVSSQMDSPNGFEPDVSPQYPNTLVISGKESSALDYIEFSIIEDSKTNSINLKNTPQELDLADKQQGSHVKQPVKSMYNKLDAITDIDHMLEKLASEFERQESLSSYTLRL